jgi:hypothetical protein
MTDKLLRIFSVFMRVAVKHFTRSEGINFEAVNINDCECVSVLMIVSVCLY